MIIPVSTHFDRKYPSPDRRAGGASVRTGGKYDSQGRRRPMGGRRGQVFMSGTKTARRGVYSAPGGKCGSQRSVRTNSHVRNESSLRDRLFGLHGRIGFDRVLAPRDMGCGPPSTFFMANNGVPPPPWSKRLVFTCNTYSPAYKGKPRKKRLSPKQVNTLIHQ